MLSQLTNLCLQRKLTLATAESCTGGGLANILTSLPGSSNWFERGFVTYSNLAKQQMLGVREATITEYGAVSEQTVTEMAAGALSNSAANVSLAITGIAGPDGGTANKPVGTVWFAWASDQFSTTSILQQFSGDREAIRQQAIDYALAELYQLLV